MTAEVKIKPRGYPPSSSETPGDRSALACLVIVARHRGLHLSVPQLIHDNVLAGPEITDRSAFEMCSVGGSEGQRCPSDLG